MRASGSQFDARQLETVANQCLQHLDREESLLAQILETLGRVREALLRGDQRALSAAVQEQETTAQAAHEVSRSRAALRQQIADCSGCSQAAVTISNLAEAVGGGLRSRLLEKRARLAHLTSQIEAIQRGNSALARESVALLNRLLGHFTGREAPVDRYGASGQLQKCGNASLFETRF